MKLILGHLTTGGELSQSITVSGGNILLKYIGIHLYKHGHPPGGIHVEVRDAFNKLISASPVITIASIDADLSSEDYYHGYTRFSVTTPLKQLTDYNIALVAGGSYVFSETASGSTGYIGWCRDYDLKKVEADYTPDQGVNSPFDLELWSLNKLQR